MVLPLTTTTVTVFRVVQDPNNPIDGYDTQPDPTQIVAGVPAVIDPPNGATRIVGGERTVYTTGFHCDPCDVRPGDTMVDAQTGLTWRVLTAKRVTAVGQDFMRGDLREVEGVAP